MPMLPACGCCVTLDLAARLSWCQPTVLLAEAACAGRRRACAHIRCAWAPSRAQQTCWAGARCSFANCCFRPLATPGCPFASRQQPCKSARASAMALALCSAPRAALGAQISSRRQDARSRPARLRVQALQQGGDDLSRKFAEAARKMNVKLPEVEAQNVATQAPPRCAWKLAPPPPLLPPAASLTRGRVAAGAGQAAGLAWILLLSTHHDAMVLVLLRQQLGALCQAAHGPRSPSAAFQVHPVPRRLERRLLRCRQGAAAGAAGAERLDHRARHAAGGGWHHCAGAAAAVCSGRTTFRCSLHPALVLSAVCEPAALISQCCAVTFHVGCLPALACCISSFRLRSLSHLISHICPHHCTLHHAR